MIWWHREHFICVVANRIRGHVLSECGSWICTSICKAHTLADKYRISNILWVNVPIDDISMAHSNELYDQFMRNVNRIELFFHAGDRARTHTIIESIQMHQQMQYAYVNAAPFGSNIRVVYVPVHTFMNAYSMISTIEHMRILCKWMANVTADAIGPSLSLVFFSSDITKELTASIWCRTSTPLAIIVCR